MSNINLLHDVVAELRALADRVETVAGAMASNKPNEGAKPEQSPDEKKQITLEEVRVVLAEKSRDGFTAEVRALLQKHGASKLSQIDPSKYAELLADAEELK